LTIIDNSLYYSKLTICFLEENFMRLLKSFLRLTMLVSIVLLRPILPVSTVMAYSDGPYIPDSGTNVTDVGSEPWVNPDEIRTPGSPYASVSLHQDQRYSNYLQAMEYGFAIPVEMEILGIEVDINRMSTSANVYDNAVRLVKDGTTTGENKAIVTTSWPTTFATTTYGGPTNLWGTSWTPADINSLDFGVALAAYRLDNGANLRIAQVDSMQITVYYGYSTTTSVVCGDGSPIVYGESLLCVATVSRIAGNMTPSGSVDWTTDGDGTFDPNPCTLGGLDGIANCSATYTPSAIGSGTHLITASYRGDDYFSPNEASQSVTVTTRPITVTADPKYKVYGNPDPELTYQVTDGSLIFDDTFSGALTREPGEDVGTYAILQGTLSLPTYYEITYVGAEFTIFGTVYWFPLIIR
jgi:hypothetical protein